MFRNYGSPNGKEQNHREAMGSEKNSTAIREFRDDRRDTIKRYLYRDKGEKVNREIPKKHTNLNEDLPNKAREKQNK